MGESGTAATQPQASRMIERRVLRDEVRERLMEDILSGKLQPGERIVETRVAKELGLSQTPVREALRDLELLGFVVTSAFRGATVRRVSPEDWAEIYPIRAALEGVAARAAAMRISDEDVRRLRELIEVMRSASQRGDKHATIEADIEFHAHIVDLSGNRVLKQLWQSLRLATTTFLTVSVTHRPLQELAERHTVVLEALISRDGASAEAAMRSHISDLADLPFSESTGGSPHPSPHASTGWPK
jgi:DNA-binding GntR family transcriptional regulator